MSASFFNLALLALLPLATVSGRPVWTDVAFASAVPTAGVVAVVESGAADLVVLEGGVAAGLRPGQVLAVSRESVAVGELLVASVGQGRAVAFLTALEPGQSLQSGDRAVARAR